MPEAAIYNWQGKFRALSVSEAKRLRALEDEKAKMKPLLAEVMLDNADFKDFLTTPAARPTARRRWSRRGAIGEHASAPVLALPNQRWTTDYFHDERAKGPCSGSSTSSTVSPASAYARRRTLLSQASVGAKAHLANRRAGQAWDGCPLQKHRADLERRPCLLRQRLAALHPSNLADGEQLHRMLQR